MNKIKFHSLSKLKERIVMILILLFSNISAYANLRDAPYPLNQEHDINGVIKNEGDNPLVGVTVQVKGTTLGTVTDSQGEFSLQVPDSAVLVVSYIGYQTKEIEVGEKKYFDIRMQPSSSGLNEVVVVGYGTQKKANLTGAVSQIGSEMLEDRPVANVSQALQGVVPNLNINFSDGRPGREGKINIRGFTSINGGNPLVLIDGIPGDIDDINPADVASISVLKDASSAAIYGARAAYGVILVTTKKGKSGKFKMTYRSNYSIETPTTSHDFISVGYNSAMLADQAYQISKGVSYTGYTDEDYEELRKRITNRKLPSVIIDNRNGEEKYVWYGNTDWWHFFFRKSKPSMSHSLQLSGGSDKVKFLLSGRFFLDKGLLKIDQDVYKSYNLRTKITADITPWFTVRGNINFHKDAYSLPGITLSRTFGHFGNHLLASSVPKNPDGSLTYMSSLNGVGLAEGYAAEYQYGKAISGDNSFKLTNTIGISLKPFSGLSIIGNFSYDVHKHFNFYRRVKVPISNSPGETSYILNDYYIQQRNLDNYTVFNLHATYSRRLNRNFFKIMGGFNQELKRYDYVRGRANYLLSEELKAFDLGTSGFELNGNQVEWALRGYFGRINYNFDNKYLLELDGRYDGSSHFPEESRYGFFPSVSAGWRISEEPFFERAKKVVSELKLRGSYGSLGNQYLSTNLRSQNYPYIQLMSTGQSGWLSAGERTRYLRVGSPVSPNLTWERTNSVDIGVDAGFLNNRLNIVFDWYNRKTLDMLIPGKTLPSVFGASSPKQNAADLKTKGFDLSIEWKYQSAIGKKTVHYSFKLLLSDFKSYITIFDNPSNLLSNYYVGQRIGEIWGYTTGGFFESNEEAKEYAVNQDFVNRTRLRSPGDGKILSAGDIKFIDINGDGVINNGKNTLEDHGDLRVIGNSLPRYSFGFISSFSWNGFDLSLFIQGIAKQDWYPSGSTYFFWGPYGKPYNSFVPKGFKNKIWSPDNPNSYFPRLRGYAASSGGSELNVVNTQYLQNAAYVRLKSFNVGYNLPKRVLNQWGIENLQIYISGENLMTITGIESDYIDPQQVIKDPNGNSGSTSARNYPFFKSYSFGINITL